MKAGAPGPRAAGAVGPRGRPDGSPAPARPARGVLALLGAWTVLDLLFNVRFPAHEPVGWYLLPSLDATALLVLAALFAWRGRRTPAPVVATAAAVVVVVRLFRIGDGVTHRYFNRPLDVALDLPLSSELGRLLGATVPAAVLIVGVPLALAVLVGVGVVAARALRAGERALGARGPRVALAGACVLAAVGSLAVGPDRYDQRRVGLFGASVIPRLAREAAFALHLDRYRATRAADIAAAARALAALPHGLERLRRANVLVFFVESYGATVLDQPDQLRLAAPVFDDIAAGLAGHGFEVASGLLDAPTYAGRSWLAHETLTTGVRADDRIADELVQRLRPLTMARVFHDAGYRTVLVQPGNRYRSLLRWLYDFDTVYSGWDFDYRGPAFRWATMPDQYVVDFVHRHELAGAHAPLLVAYTLISSHAPWSDQPTLVADWSQIGDGAIYATHPRDHYPITWTNLGDGAEAYVRSVGYDLRMIADYVTRFVTGDALVVVLGDHQPVAEVTRGSASHAVPVHVISRSHALVAPFEARGYVPGMRPSRTGPPPRGMETFLPDLLVDFSEPGP